MRLQLNSQMSLFEWHWQVYPTWTDTNLDNITLLNPWSFQKLDRFITAGTKVTFNLIGYLSSLFAGVPSLDGYFIDTEAIAQINVKVYNYFQKVHFNVSCLGWGVKSENWRQKSTLAVRWLSVCTVGSEYTSRSFEMT